MKRCIKKERERERERVRDECERREYIWIRSVEFAEVLVVHKERKPRPSKSQQFRPAHVMSTQRSKEE